MKQCPECRSPIYSLMMLDARNEPEHYCERCARGYAVRKAAPALSRREPVPA
jgi:uncharacterized protein YbaR (Trm112 family)